MENTKKAKFDFAKQNVRKNLNYFKNFYLFLIKRWEFYLVIIFLPFFLSFFIYLIDSSAFKSDMRYPIAGAIFTSNSIFQIFLIPLLGKVFKDKNLKEGNLLDGIGKIQVILFFIISSIVFTFIGFFINLSLILTLEQIIGTNSVLNWIEYLFDNGFWTFMGYIFGLLSLSVLCIITSLMISWRIQNLFIAYSVLIIYLLIILVSSDIVIDPLDYKNNVAYSIAGYINPFKYNVWITFLYSSGANIEFYNSEYIIPTDGNLMFLNMWSPVLFTVLINVFMFVILLVIFQIDNENKKELLEK